VGGLETCDLKPARARPLRCTIFPEAKVASFSFRCTECGAAYRDREVALVCPACSERQEAGGVTRGVLEVVIDELPGAWPSDARHCYARFAGFLPLATIDTLPPIAVGDTPLLEVPRLRAEFDMPRLWLKDDTRNPSGSTKDRASLLVAAKAREYGFDTIATASTGNAATALAAVAAAAGLRAVLFVPESAPRGKLVQMLAYGARVVLVRGSYDAAFELCLAACERFGWYNRNTALNPFTIEGKKTAALEIAESMKPESPDAVVVPTGDGVILAGVAKGFADLVRCGLISRQPRLIAVQPAGSAAIARAVRTGASAIEPVPDAASVADSLTVQVPRNAIRAIRTIRESGGTAVIVTDDEIVTAIAHLARSTGVFAEPAGAASLAGLIRALEEGVIDRDERVVLMVTGQGLKDIDAAARSVTFPASVAPELEAIGDILQE
jgi:threonine synthase